MKKLICIALILTVVFVQPDRLKNKSTKLLEFTMTESVLLKMDLSLYSLEMALDFYEIQHKDIVISQAILETGWFTSDLCVKNHNLFGLFNSSKMEMYKFKHWSQSVKAYKTMIQYRYLEKDKTYYHFLKRIKYAEDPEYIKKLKTINKRKNES